MEEQDRIMYKAIIKAIHELSYVGYNQTYPFFIALIKERTKLEAKG